MTDTTGRYTKKPITITASQWFKNGDHPDDYVGETTGLENGELRQFTGEYRRAQGWEGSVVRYFRHPDVPGESLCEQCGKPHQVHGWVDTLEKGHRVCPGDWIITGVKGEYYPCKPDIFEMTYQPADATHALREAQPIDMILYCPSCGVQHVDKPEGQFYPGHTAEESAAVNKDHGLWDNPPHRSHLCHACGCIWRPADVPTNGVESIKTEGKADTWPAQAAQREPISAQAQALGMPFCCGKDERQADEIAKLRNVVQAAMIAGSPEVFESWNYHFPDDRREVPRAAQRPAAPAPQDSREAFEAWFDGEYQELARIVGDGVAASIRNASRNAWQAALASRPVPPPISDDEAEDLIDAANRKFNAYRSSIRGQQLTVLDDWKHWLIREVIAARDAQWKGGV